MEPRIVMAGFNCPSSLNNDLQSTLAKGLFGSGSTGVPLEGINFRSEKGAAEKEKADETEEKTKGEEVEEKKKMKRKRRKAKRKEKKKKKKNVRGKRRRTSEGKEVNHDEEDRSKN